MSTQGSPQSIDMEKLTELLGQLLKILGSTLGATSLGLAIIYGIGFIVANTSLLRHGAFEQELARTEFLAAGFSFLVVTLAVTFLGTLAVDPLATAVEKRSRESYRLISLILLFLATAFVFWIAFLLVTSSAEGEQWWATYRSVALVSFGLIFVGALPLRSLLAILDHRLHRPVLSGIVIFFAGALALGLIYLISSQRPSGELWWEDYANVVLWGYPIVFGGALIVEYAASKLAESLLNIGPNIAELGRLHRWLGYVIVFVAGMLVLLIFSWLIRLFPQGVKWLDRYGRAIIWGYIAGLIGGIYLEDLRNRKFLENLTTSPVKLAEIARPLLLGVLLLLIALVSFGAYAYPQLPKSVGGGSPVFVEFLVEDGAQGMLEALGLEVAENRITERVEFLIASPERVFVRTQRGDTLSFAASLVQASKFYNVDWYVSSEAHLTTAIFYAGQAQWDIAIQEYTNAILVQADLFDAWIGRGIAYLEKFVALGEESSYLSANRNLTKALELNKTALELAESNADPLDAASTKFERSRLNFHRFLKDTNDDRASRERILGLSSDDLEDAVGAEERFLVMSLEDIAGAIEINPPLLRDILGDDVFQIGILATGDAFRRAISESDKQLAEQLDAIATSLQEEAILDLAADIYANAAFIADRFIGELMLAARYNSSQAQVLEQLMEFEDALKAWDNAIKNDKQNTNYQYRRALLFYSSGISPDRAADQCENIIGNFQEGEGELGGASIQPVIGCHIVRGNVSRDKAMIDEATSDYREAVRQAHQHGLAALTANGYYQWARLEARREGVDQALALLEKAVWLDRSIADLAKGEADLEILRELTAFDEAISPPVILGINVSEDGRSIVLVIQDPLADFPIRLLALTEILGELSLVTLEGAGQAESVEVSEDQLTHTFHLKENSSYTANKITIALREVLRLEE